MKPYALLIALFFCASGVSVAQQRTRDVLFPDFQKDRDNMKKKEAKLKSTPATAKATRSVKEQLFTDYQPQNTTRSAKSQSRKAAPTTSKLPSDISSADAAAAARTQQPAQTVTIPSQGNETEKSNGPVNNAAPVKTPAPPTTVAPATRLAPVKQPIGRNKQ